MEKIIMSIISNAGTAKSQYIDAMKLAMTNEFDKAKDLFKEANENVIKAHIEQTKLISNEIQGNNIEISLLTVHAQDHLTMALVTRDLVELLIQYISLNYSELQKLKGGE